MMHKARSSTSGPIVALLGLLMTLPDVRANLRFSHLPATPGTGVTPEAHETVEQLERANPYAGTYLLKTGPEMPDMPLTISCDGKLQMTTAPDPVPLHMQGAKEKCEDMNVPDAIMYSPGLVASSPSLVCFTKVGDNLRMWGIEEGTPTTMTLELMHKSTNCGDVIEDANPYAGSYLLKSVMGDFPVRITCDSNWMLMHLPIPVPLYMKDAKDKCEGLKVNEAVMYSSGPDPQNPAYVCFTKASGHLRMWEIGSGTPTSVSVEMTKADNCGRADESGAPHGGCLATVFALLVARHIVF